MTGRACDDQPTQVIERRPVKSTYTTYGKTEEEFANPVMLGVEAGDSNHDVYDRLATPAPPRPPVPDSPLSPTPPTS